MKVGFVICVVVTVIAVLLPESPPVYADPQLGQLSYTNADIGEKLVRSQTTTTPVPTTKKSSFFGGLRNIFRKDTTTAASLDDVSTTSTTPLSISTTTTKSIVAGLAAAKQAVVAPVVPVNPVEPTSTSTIKSITHPATPTTAAATPAVAHSTPTTARPRQPLHDFESFATITLSTKAPKVKEDFPALPTRPNQREEFPALPAPRQPSTGGKGSPSQGGTTATPVISTTANAWSSLPTLKPTNQHAPTPTPSHVNFIPNAHSSTPRSVAAPTVSPGETTNAELETLTEALFTKETSLLSTVTINYQAKTQSSTTVDQAPLPLLTVDDVALGQNPTVAKIKLLYNNYEQDVAVNEHVTAMERSEENDLIDHLLTSSIMRHAMKFLQQKGKVTLDPQSHRDLLKPIWFNLYSRSKGKIGSSAFEHVFLTELRNGTVSGFHNWIYYAGEERAGRADYQGWLKKVELGNKGAILKYRFIYNGTMKHVNAMFLGTSPELEVALYTVCFAVRADKECNVSMDGQKFIIRTHTFRYRGKNLIGSAFPDF